MAQFNIADAKARFSEIVRKALQGEEIVIARANRPLLKLVPLARPGHRRPGSGRGEVLYVAPDFDALPEGFEEHA